LRFTLSFTASAAASAASATSTSSPPTLPTLFLLLPPLPSTALRDLRAPLLLPLLPHPPLHPLPSVIHPLLFLPTQLPRFPFLLPPISRSSIQFNPACLLCGALVFLGLEPGTFGTGEDFFLVVDDVFALLELHLGRGKLFFFFFVFENFFDFIGHGFDFLRPGVCFYDVNDSRYDFCALSFACFDGGFDDFSVGLRSNGAGSTGTASASGSTDAVQVYFMGLGGFVVDDCGNVLDVETAGGDICGEEKGNGGGAKGFDGGNTL